MLCLVAGGVGFDLLTFCGLSWRQVCANPTCNDGVQNGQVRATICIVSMRYCWCCWSCTVSYRAPSLSLLCVVGNRQGLRRLDRSTFDGHAHEHRRRVREHQLAAWQEVRHRQEVQD
jgi:hypothetical protein